MTIQNIEQTSLSIDRLTSFLQDSENVKKFLSVCIEEVEELANALLALAGQKDISTVEGVWLDFIGSIVGKERSDRSDEEYRNELLLKVSINIANGTHPATSDIIKTYTKSDNIKLVKGILSWGHIIFDGEDNADFSLWSLVEDIVPVTTAHIVMQDTQKKCMFPAWADGSWDESTAFQIHTGEDFEVVFNSNLDTDTLVFSMENNSDGGAFHTDRWLLGWDEPEGLQVTEGDSEDLLLFDEDGENILSLHGNYAESDTSVLLPWEINEFCTQSFLPPQELEILESNVQSLTTFVNTHLFTTLTSV